MLHSLDSLSWSVGRCHHHHQCSRKVSRKSLGQKEMPPKEVIDTKYGLERRLPVLPDSEIRNQGDPVPVGLVVGPTGTAAVVSVPWRLLSWRPKAPTPSGPLTFSVTRHCDVVCRNLRCNPTSDAIEGNTVQLPLRLYLQLRSDQSNMNRTGETRLALFLRSLIYGIVGIILMIIDR